jgi:hypothetical protein
MYREALLEEVRRAALARTRNGWRNIVVSVTRPVTTQLTKSFESPSIATSNSPIEGREGSSVNSHTNWLTFGVVTQMIHRLIFSASLT